MKVTFHRQLTWDKLKRVVPAKFRGLTTIIPREKNLYAAIIFPSDDDYTLLSPEIKKALQEVPESDGEHIVLFAYNVTAEACEAIDARGATLLKLRDFFWTDGRLREIRKMV